MHACEVSPAKINRKSSSKDASCQNAGDKNLHSRSMINDSLKTVFFFVKTVNIQKYKRDKK